MNNDEYLNEEKYQIRSKRLLFIGVIIILLGLVGAAFILVPKITDFKKENQEELQQQLNQLKPELERRYAELEARGVQESSDYKDKDGYEMKLIDIALDPTYDTCESSSVYSDNDVTREYCKIKAQLYKSNDSFANGRIMYSIVPAFMILMPCLAFGGMLIMAAKRREIMAFQMQQVMPVAQEGISKMSPTLGKSAGTIAKSIKDGLRDDHKF